MSIKAFRIIPVILITALLLVNPWTVGSSSAASFTDTVNHWSGPVVEKTYALDLMKGYPGNVFKPEQPVSRLEAIAIIIRAMGLEEKANTLDWKNSNIKLPSGMFWGQGHLVLAAEQGLIHKDYVNQLLYTDPITRAEVSTLVSLALRDKLKVKGDPAKLTFSDTNKISPDYRQFVADVTQNGIMQGISATEFGPNDNMKRGQMAALMFKTTQDGWFTYRSSNLLTGKLSNIDPASNIMTITKDDGTQVFRPLSSKAIYYNDSKETALSDFSVGERVLAITDNSGNIIYLEKYSGTTPVTPPDSSGTEQVITGKIIDQELTGSNTIRIQDSLYNTHQYPLATAVVISSSSGNKDLSQLTNGKYITVKVKDNEIQNITILDQQTWEGTVSHILSGQIILQLQSGENRIFTVDESKLKILSNGSKLPFSSLKAGDIVELVTINGNVQEITLQSYENEAEIRAIDDFYYMVTLLFNDGTRKEFEVQTNALIIKDGERVRLDDLAPGDEITFKLGSSGRINEITVRDEEGDVTGEVTRLTFGSTPRIYVDSKRYDVDDDVEITRDDDEIDLEDIMIGAEVSLDLNSKDEVIGIKVLNDTDITIEGFITDVDVKRNRITIEQSSGQEFTIRVSSRCVFRDSTSSGRTVSDIDDLDEDWEVRIYLEDGIAETIRVLEK